MNDRQQPLGCLFVASFLAGFILFGGMRLFLFVYRDFGPLKWSVVCCFGIAGGGVGIALMLLGAWFSKAPRVGGMVMLVLLWASFALIGGVICSLGIAQLFLGEPVFHYSRFGRRRSGWFFALLALVLPPLTALIGFLNSFRPAKDSVKLKCRLSGLDCARAFGLGVLWFSGIVMASWFALQYSHLRIVFFGSGVALAVLLGIISFFTSLHEKSK